MAWLRPLWRGPRRYGMALDALTDPGFVALDLETTGLDARTDLVVAAAVIPVVGGAPRAGYVTLVNPGRPIPPTASAIHGITDAMVKAAPTIDEALGHIDRVAGPHLIVGHGVRFDIAILARERQAHGRRPPANPILCTMRLAAVLNPAWGDVGLDAVADRLGIQVDGRHTAQGDAEAAARIFLALVPAARARGARTLADLQWLDASAAL